MRPSVVRFLIAALLLAVCNAEVVQLASSQGIVIPSNIAEALRFSRSSYGAPAAPPAPSYSAPAAPSYSAPAPSAPVQIPAPPCPKNYIVSCQPSLASVPCASSAPAPSYSAPAPSSYSAPAPAPQGAYSHFVPQYTMPIVQELY